MTNYWDLSVKERSELTEDQIKGFLDYELMAKGALKPKAPQLREIPPSPLCEQTTYYTIECKDRYGTRNKFDICFATAEQAAKFHELNPIMRDYDYEVGSEFQYAKPVGEVSIVAEKLYTQEQINLHRSTMKQRKSAIEENERLTAAFQKACQASEKITEGIWKDYYDSVSRRKYLETVVSTYKDYLKLTKDDHGLAVTFLAKVFDTLTITEAREWFPDFIPAETQGVGSPEESAQPE